MPMVLGDSLYLQIPTADHRLTTPLGAYGGVAGEDGFANLGGQIASISVTPRDSDGDGLEDLEEWNVTGTHAGNADTDGDGLDDGEELNVHGTNALLPDTDGDGFFDGQEIAAGSDPNDPGSVPAMAVPALGLMGRAVLLALMLVLGTTPIRRARGL